MYTIFRCRTNSFAITFWMRATRHRAHFKCSPSDRTHAHTLCVCAGGWHTHQCECQCLPVFQIIILLLFFCCTFCRAEKYEPKTTKHQYICSECTCLRRTYMPDWQKHANIFQLRQFQSSHILTLTLLLRRGGERERERRKIFYEYVACSFLGRIVHSK